LNISNNTNKINLNQFKKIKYLYARGNVECDLSLLNLEYLDVSDNVIGIPVQKCTGAM